MTEPYGVLIEVNPFYKFFPEGKIPLMPIVFGTKQVTLEGSKETECYFLDASRCDEPTLEKIAEHFAELVNIGMNPQRVISLIEEFKRKPMPIRKSQILETHGLEPGVSLRYFT